MKSYFEDDALQVFVPLGETGSSKQQEQCIQSQKQDVIYDAVVLDAKLRLSSSDEGIAVLRAHRAEIEQWGIRLALAKEASLAIAIRKDHTLAVAERLGLGIPREVRACCMLMERYMHVLPNGPSELTLHWAEYQPTGRV